MSPYQALRQLDQRAFLGFRIWEFCARSLSQPYGRVFLRCIVLRHPLRTLAGLLAYRRFARQPHRSAVYPVGVDSVAAFQDAATKGELLVAVGFCQKPLPRPGVHYGCPAGRANHRCSYLEGNTGTGLHPACQECHIRLVATKALAAGATMHIMTSALDIAYDIFLPTLRCNRFPRAILSVCPYSVQPIALPILICGMQALVFTYGSGDCRTYEQWLRADRGVKPERTFLPAPANRQLLAVLDAIARARVDRCSTQARTFRREGHFYISL
jgi:hypothetical protein